jgi:Lrp/AsnC family leucine-responsive transcriptional regulator
MGLKGAPFRSPHQTARPEVTPVSADPLDLAILLCLARDARRSIRNIAAEIGMSPPPVAERLAKLEAKGVIAGYHASIDWGILGYGLVAYVSVTCIQGFEQAATVQALEALPEVEQVDLVTGNADLLVRLRVKDTEHLRALIFNGVWNVPGLERTETCICLSGSHRVPFEPKFAEALVGWAQNPEVAPASASLSQQSAEAG